MEQRTFVRRTAVFIAFAATGILGFFWGFSEARRGAKDAEPAISVTMPYFPDCSGADRAARRNIVWNALNGDVEAARDSNDMVALISARVLFMMLHPEAPPEARREGADIYLHKAAGLLSPEELASLERAVAETDLAGVANGLAAMNRQERESAAFMACVLHDAERVSAFLRGEPVPLETVP